MTVPSRIWAKTQRLPFVIFADFQALLVETEQRSSMNTRTNSSVSYGLAVKALDDVLVWLFERFAVYPKCR